MARVKTGPVRSRRHKKVLKKASGYWGSKSRSFKAAHEQVMHSGVYAFRDRRQKKRDFRSLWILRINAACRQNNITYSRFIKALNDSGLKINRKILAELAAKEPESFASLVSFVTKSS
jgi:large subunit ribosomal protein L20